MPLLMSGVVGACFGAGSCFAQFAGDRPIGLPSPANGGLRGETVPDGKAKTSDKREVFAPKGNIQLAILLDVSGSMDGLIEQARTQLWKVINRLSHSFQEGKPSRVSVALYAYGDMRGGEDQIICISPFTDNFDDISDKLYKLQCSGSSEYCGTVIEKAVSELAWNTEDPRSLKMIFIAGNEAFDQATATKPVAYKDAIAHAKRCGILVNTIHCAGLGTRPGEEELWKKAASLGGGSFVSIDQSATTSEAGSPMDADILKKSEDAYADFIPFGSPSAQRFLKAKVADEIANPGMTDTGVKIERLLTKILLAGNDRNSLDLVTRFAPGREEFSFDAIGGEACVPLELAGKSEDEIRKFIRTRYEERMGTLAELDKAVKGRERWLKSRAKKADRSLGGAIISSVTKQAKTKRISFDPPTDKGQNASAKPDFRKLYPSYDAVWQAISKKDKRLLNKLLEADWDSNQKKNTETVLMIAVMDGQPKLVDFLLKSGMSANGCDANGLSALAYAVRRGDREIAETLIFKGADVNTWDSNGSSVLMDAVQRGNREILRLLLDSSVRVNDAGPDGQTPLMVAARRGDDEIFSILLDKGAKADAATSYGCSVLMDAVSGGNPEIVPAVLKLVTDVNLRDATGYTPLMEAARLGRMEIVKMLLAKGADGTEQNDEGKTAADLAATAEIRKVIADAPKPLRPVRIIMDDDRVPGSSRPKRRSSPAGTGMRPGGMPPPSGSVPGAGTGN